MALLIRRLIIEGIEPLPSGDLNQFEVAEGGLVTVVVRKSERDRGLREKKSQRVRSDGKQLDCEVCGINFGEAYGLRGQGYIAVHHILPLHVSGSVITMSDDLVLLCSNCHQMVHQTPWITPDRLKADCAEVGENSSLSSG
ncbi:putative HNH restriction endonuclease [Frigoribacterium sp. PvP120]|uniref:HNH endonuclease n=1 Tax=unclassified Frigoribacterium TaxID=2627005 RepID=UPI001AE1D812|nr:HNH endonuclease [Frigoribacterium sp. PvP121]MBP1242144.1 putative HNH restriction endonuclease [Frigoribacterium sp. PvP121]